jgi:hypothetical protein
MSTTSSATAHSQNHLISLAKQGDPTALTTLINQTLSPLGVVVNSVLNSECLVITAIIPDNIDRQFLIRFMREGMERLQANSIRQVMLVGRDREQISPDWQHILNLYQADLPPTTVKRRRAKINPVVATATTTTATASSAATCPTPAAATSPQRRRRHWLIRKPTNRLLNLAAILLLGSGAWAAKVVFLVDNSSDRQLNFTQEVEKLAARQATISLEKLATASVDHLRTIEGTWCGPAQGWEPVLAEAVGLGLIERKLLPEDQQELWIVAQPNRRFQMKPQVEGSAILSCLQPIQANTNVSAKP